MDSFNQTLSAANQQNVQANSIQTSISKSDQQTPKSNDPEITDSVADPDLPKTGSRHSVIQTRRDYLRTFSSSSAKKMEPFTVINIGPRQRSSNNSRPNSLHAGDVGGGPGNGQNENNNPEAYYSKSENEITPVVLDLLGCPRLINLVSSLSYPVRVFLYLFVGNSIILLPVLLKYLNIKVQDLLLHPAEQWCYWTAIVFSTFFLFDIAWRILIGLARWRATLPLTQDFIDYADKLKFKIIRLFWSLVALISWDSQLSPGDCQPVSLLEIQCPLNVFRKILVSLTWTCLLLLFESMVLNRIAYKFHQEAYHDRLEKNRFGRSIIDVLRQKLNAVSLKSQSNGRGLSKGMEHLLSMGKLGSGKDDPKVQDPKHLEKPEISITCVKNRDDFESGTDLNNHHHQNIFHDLHHYLSNFQIFKREETRLGTGRNAISAEQEKKTITEAKVVALRLYNELLDRANAIKTSDNNNNYRESLMQSDFEPFFTGYTAVCSTASAFALFDPQQTGIVTRQDFKYTIVTIFRETLNLSKGLLATNAALRILDQILVIIAMAISFFIWLSVFEVNITGLLTIGISVILALQVVVGTSIKNCFEAAVVIFVLHPFDIGDKIILDGTTYVVTNIHFLTTLLRQWDGQIHYIANHTLLSKTIINIRRNPEPLMQRLEYLVDIKTVSQPQLENMYLTLYNFVRGNGSDYIGGKLEIQPVADTGSAYTGGNTMKIAVLFQPKTPTTSVANVTSISSSNSGLAQPTKAHLQVVQNSGSSSIVIDSSLKKLRRILVFNQQVLKAAAQEGIAIIEANTITTIKTTESPINSIAAKKP